MEYRLVGAAGLQRLSGGVAYQSKDAHRFPARFISVPMESIAFEDLSATSFSCAPSNRVLDPPEDLVRIVSVLRGLVHAEFEGTALRLVQGDVAVIGAHPFHLRTEDVTRIATVIVPRSSLRSRREDLEHTQLAALRSPLVPIWFGLMRSLAASAPNDNTREADLLSHAVIDIARGLIALKDPVTKRRAPEELLRRAYDIIERDYTDPLLRAAQIARMLDLSERRLHRLFADEELSVGERIRATRVQAAAVYLISKSDSFGIIAVRVGFSSSDAAHRAFRAVKTISPAEYRSRGLLK